MVDFEKLNDQAKEGNLLPARLAIMRLEGCGFRVIPKEQAGGRKVMTVDKSVLRKLARSEHRRWMREKLVQGIAYGAPTDDAALLHKDIGPFEFLDSQERRLDRDIIKAVVKFLDQRGLVLAKLRPTD
jgi:hypothetical protein